MFIVKNVEEEKKASITIPNPPCLRGIQKAKDLFKRTGSPDELFFGHVWIDLGVNKGRAWFEFFSDVPPM